MNHSHQQNWPSFIDSAQYAWESWSEVDRQAVHKAFYLSEYVAQSLTRLVEIDNGMDRFEELSATIDWRCEIDNMRTRLSSINDEVMLKKQLRIWRMQWMTLIAIRNFSQLSSIETDCSDISELADALIEVSYEWLMRSMKSHWGNPHYPSGEQQNLLIAAMGKYGGKELNFSSDVDLIFYYGEEGETQGGARSVDHHRFFTRLGQRLISVLNETTADGFVYRVDMRLRPYGESGPLAISFAAAEDYYQEQGREWERFAMVKARLITGTEQEKTEFYRLIRPFVFRRYIDFGVLDAIRQMKQLIATEVSRKGLQDNIKLGQGGIREAEFVVQALQLIRGGRLTALQRRGFATALTMLTESGMIPADAANSLSGAYWFLRRVEHALQQFSDQQTQQLPDNADGLLHLANALCLVGPDELSSQLNQARHVIRREFNALFETHQAASDGTSTEQTGVQQDSTGQPVASSDVLLNAPSITSSIVLSPHADVELDDFFKLMDRDQQQAIAARLNQFKESHAFTQMSELGRQRLEKFLPSLLWLLDELPQPVDTLAKLLDLIKAVSTRTAYLVLLAENPPVLQQLVSLTAKSDWIAKRLSEFPILLDELLYPSSLYQPLAIDELKQELQRQTLRIDPDDDEQLQEQLRVFKQTNELRVAAASITELLDVRHASRMLSRIAEAVIEAVLQIAWRGLCRRHGVPNIDQASIEKVVGFSVIGYGKLGGEELGFASDLDLVFLYRGDPDKMTQGKRPISHSQFYTRLAQRMIHMLSLRSMSGMLYEIDTRLRPSGNSGFLVSHLDAFAEYQQQEAWTWEHQALVRARPVAGDLPIASAIEELRQTIIATPRVQTDLQREVVSMRDKMRTNLDQSKEGWFDIKQAVGGTVDIEFLVQYWVLEYGQRVSNIIWSSRTTELLRQLQDCKVIEPAQAAVLIQAYRHYRQISNQCALHGKPAVVELEHVIDDVGAVEGVWRQVMGKAD